MVRKLPSTRFSAEEAGGYLVNKASPFWVSLHTSCTSAQKCCNQNKMMMVLPPRTISSEQ